MSAEVTTASNRWPIAVIVTVTLAAASWILSSGMLIERITNVVDAVENLYLRLEQIEVRVSKITGAAAEHRAIQLQVDYLREQYRDLRKECDRIAHGEKR